MISYLLLLSVYWLVGLALYYALLRPVAAHAFNRAFLLVVTLSGLFAPLLPAWGKWVSTISGSTEAGLLDVWLPGLTVLAQGEAAWSAAQPSPLFYGCIAIGFGVSLMLFVRNGLALYRLQRTRRPVPNTSTSTGLTVFETPEARSPFSFGAALYVHDWMSMSPDQQRLLLRHESAHHQLRHAWDNVAVALVCLLMWFHPLSYVLRRELRLVHEFQADAYTLQRFSIRDYRRALLANQLGVAPSGLVAAFHHSPITTRLNMMTIRFRQNQTWRLATAAFAFLLLGVACTKDSISDEELAVLNEIGGEDYVASLTNVDGLELQSSDTVTMYNPSTELEEVTVVGFYASKDGSRSKKLVRRIDNPNSTTEFVRNEPVFKIVEEMPTFPAEDCAGDQDCHQKRMLQWIYTNVRYPKAAREAGAEGTSVVSFVVGRDGEILKPTIVREVSPEIDAEVLRLTREMPVWNPGRQGGNVVQTRFHLPIKFKLS